MGGMYGGDDLYYECICSVTPLADLFQGIHLGRSENYEIVTNGSCESHGLTTIRSLDECRGAVSAMNLASSASMFSTNDAPYGCVHENGSGGYQEGVIFNPFEDSVECGIYGYYDC